MRPISAVDRLGPSCQDHIAPFCEMDFKLDGGSGKHFIIAPLAAQPHLGFGSCRYRSSSSIGTFKKKRNPELLDDGKHPVGESCNLI